MNIKEILVSLPSIQSVKFLLDNYGLSHKQKNEIMVFIAEACIGVFKERYFDNTTIDECLAGIKEYNNGNIYIEEMNTLKRKIYKIYADIHNSKAEYIIADDNGLEAVYVAYGMTHLIISHIEKCPTSDSDSITSFKAFSSALKDEKKWDMELQVLKNNIINWVHNN